ncbi:iron dicitrate transport regulator FecR [Rubrivivax gelatinosus]|nr:iron dicitrate transport regulator FecR [Rubrivivax gelatinosus]
MAAGRNAPQPADGLAVDHASLEQAALWYATLRAETAGDAERRAWQAWLAQSPLHARAWAHIAGLGALLLAGREWPLPAGIAAIGAAWRTGTGEQREIVLDDGSRVWLNTGSALDAEFAADRRRLLLHAGEILVETAADRFRRPFWVDTADGRMQALGTRFAVCLSAGRTRLDVFDGVVLVRNQAGAVLQVPAGRGAVFDAASLGRLAAADPAREAWSRGLVVADGITLAELAAELARYRRGHLGVAPAVAGLKVVGVFPAQQPDRALAMLEAALPLRVQRTLPWWVSLEPR